MKSGMKMVKIANQTEMKVLHLKMALVAGTRGDLYAHEGQNRGMNNDKP